jgi:predicted transcriptional regulator
MRFDSDGIVRGANEVADNLRMLAITIREHSKIAGEHVADFCNRATAVLDGVRDVEAKLRAGLHETQRNETELKASLAIEQPLPDEIGTVPPDEFQLKVAPRPTSQRRD